MSLLNYALFSFFAVDRGFCLFVGNHEKNLVFLQIITMIQQFLFKESINCITTAKKQKKGFGGYRAEKSANYQAKAKMLLWFRFKLKQRD